MSLRIAQSIAAAASHLHSRGILHGDLYPHNILTNSNGDSFLGDFGAATFFDMNDASLCTALERLEARAFSCLLQDLLDRCPPHDAETNGEVFQIVRSMQQACMSPTVTDRPRFQKIGDELKALTV